MARNYHVTWILFGVMLIFFIIQVMNDSFTELLLLDTEAFFGQPWTAVTAIFIHGGLEHFMFNMFGLLLFGTILEHVIGSKKFLQIFIAAGVMGSFASLPFYDRVLGASGAIFGVMGMLAILRPKLVVWVYSMPMPMIAALFVWILADVFGIFAPGNTANIAHLGGIGLGVVFGFLNRKHYPEQRRQKKKDDVDIDEEKVKAWEKQF